MSLDRDRFRSAQHVSHRKGNSRTASRPHGPLCHNKTSRDVLHDTAARPVPECLPQRQVHFPGSGCGSSVTTCHGLPVNHVEERLDVVGTPILIVQVISVFPDIEAEDRGPS